MSRWWRAYEEAVDDPKLQRLPDALFKAWFNLMCLTSRHGGSLPPIEDIAFSLRLSETKTRAILAGLENKGLLDRTESGAFQPHNWNARQYKSDTSTDRVKQFRERKAQQDGNVSSAVAVTPPETETETETEQNRAEKTVRAVAVATRPEAEKIFDERFWPEYPKRGDAANPKKPAKDKFVRLVRDGTDPEVMISAARRFCQIEREAGRYGTDKVAQAITWLNQQRFGDYAESAPVKPTGPPPGLPSDEELRRKYGAEPDEGQTGPRGSVESLAGEDQEPGGSPVLRAGAGVHPPEWWGGIRAGGGHRGAQGVGQILRGLGLGASDLQRNAAGGEGRGEAVDDGPEPMA
jgi:hypothetical protein